MATSPARGVFWFRHDLRLHDNPALEMLSHQADELACIYIINPAWFEKNTFGVKPMGKIRYEFLMQSLANLNDQLQALGHQLQVFTQSPRSALTHIIDTYRPSAVGVSQHCGEYERQDVRWLQSVFTGSLFTSQATTLYRAEDLPFSLGDMPGVYTPFRKRVEQHACVPSPHQAVASLPPMLALEGATTPQSATGNNQFTGGEEAGLSHLARYFASDHPACYKETRNALDCWEDSTKFSPWLATGCISPRRVYADVNNYEKQVTKNDSTYWIKFELLWREFFHWQAVLHQHRWFAFGGIQLETPSTSFNTKVFNEWCQGETGYDIVDACMRQLNQTGYMSNRGRQLVASCFVHELAQDWRYGAAYFEQQLIDYDVASNWGNWLYLAGVGSDPRGHRQFNLKKQTSHYDPDGVFRDKWLN